MDSCAFNFHLSQAFTCTDSFNLYFIDGDTEAEGDQASPSRSHTQWVVGLGFGPSSPTPTGLTPSPQLQGVAPPDQELLLAPRDSLSLPLTS